MHAPRDNTGAEEHKSIEASKPTFNKGACPSLNYQGMGVLPTKHLVPDKRAGKKNVSARNSGTFLFPATTAGRGLILIHIVHELHANVTIQYERLLSTTSSPVPLLHVWSPWRLILLVLVSYMQSKGTTGGPYQFHNVYHTVDTDRTALRGARALNPQEAQTAVLADRRICNAYSGAEDLNPGRHGREKLLRGRADRSAL
ncbi:hypothetical protein F4804DRAFT_336815 [Jackrogersella minutella]|nr:hypothetical protein F4804DRAFT_336815 [Jackrogersella minutella]